MFCRRAITSSRTCVAKREAGTAPAAAAAPAPAPALAPAEAEAEEEDEEFDDDIGAEEDGDADEGDEDDGDSDAEEEGAGPRPLFTSSPSSPPGPAIAPPPCLSIPVTWLRSAGTRRASSAGATRRSTRR